MDAQIIKIIEDTARQIIIDTLEIPETEYGPDLAIEPDPLGLVQLAMQLEFKFGIEIDEESFVKVKTVADVLGIVKAKMRA